jgi:hypothetical protein
MASNYTGNPTASQTPSPNPGFGAAPILHLPVDGEPLNVASIYQGLKALADWTAWLTVALSPYRGVTNWSGSNPDYTVNDIVIDGSDNHLYQCIYSPPDTGFAPHSNPTYWKRIDWSEQDVQAIAAKQTAVLGDITASHGGSVAGSYEVAFNRGGLKCIMFDVANVPRNSYSDVDLNGSATKFSTFCCAGFATDNTMSSYGGTCGLYRNLGGDRNVHRVWSSQSSPNPTTTVSVQLWGA